MIEEKVVALQKLKDGGLLMTMRNSKDLVLSKNYGGSRYSSVVHGVDYTTHMETFRATMSYDEFSVGINRILAAMRIEEDKEDIPEDTEVLGKRVYAVFKHLTSYNSNFDRNMASMRLTNDLFIAAVPEDQWPNFVYTEAQVEANVIKMMAG
jgi:hypothetical protein